MKLSNAGWNLWFILTLISGFALFFFSGWIPHTIGPEQQDILNVCWVVWVVQAIPCIYLGCVSDTETRTLIEFSCGTSLLMEDTYYNHQLLAYTGTNFPFAGSVWDTSENAPYVQLDMREPELEYPQVGR